MKSLNIIFYALLLCSQRVVASETNIKIIRCLDANPNTLAPVFFDTESIEIKMPLVLGNIVPVVEQAGKTHKDVTVYGNIDSSQLENNKLILTGSFGTRFTLDLQTNTALVDGPLKYDPISGRYLTYSRVFNYNLNCIVTYQN